MVTYCLDSRKKENPRSLSYRCFREPRFASTFFFLPLLRVSGDRARYRIKHFRFKQFYFLQEVIFSSPKVIYSAREWLPVFFCRCLPLRNKINHLWPEISSAMVQDGCCTFAAARFSAEQKVSENHQQQT